jgi:hypothetical protein
MTRVQLVLFDPLLELVSFRHPQFDKLSHDTVDASPQWVASAQESSFLI